MGYATGLQVLGVLMLAVGAALVHVAAGVILGGVGLLAFGVAMERR